VGFLGENEHGDVKGLRGRNFFKQSMFSGEGKEARTGVVHLPGVRQSKKYPG
jgi:hypothetical protein